MTATERRASGALAAIYALRMLGLFLVLPVFALQARHYPGGDDPALVGLAMGIYGLTQALLQVPLGMASDRLGRKPVILAGLAVFVLGSSLAAWAPSLPWLVAGRALQGAGAISAAVTALLADLTRDEVRTKSMALVGISIALMFALSLVAAPLLVAHIGLGGLFALTAALALLGMAVIVWVVPPEPALHQAADRGGLRQVLAHADLLRVDLGVFVLHAVQIAMWMAVPALLVESGVAPPEHWKVYLPAVLASLLIMGGLLFRLERMGHFKAVYLGAIALIGLVQLGFLFSLQAPSLWGVAVLLCLYFVGFNTQEASQPSLASRLAQPHQRGAALGVYNTLMSLGIFTGGSLGGLVARAWGSAGIFAVSALLMLLWFGVAWRMRTPHSASARP
ncbi:MAG: MFS transporter [Hydrogenophaga sp.]|jgi:MFS family permease|uniref:MFS transporter n=1 Tax=Hydrogenophaga sp. TaxID=1904254 RepID=UPI0026139575|nr:MFS transporter [Hydrogenophaga sp.]MCV0439082.1 MFS transporter [Hydrogenophaga sp.]